MAMPITVPRYTIQDLESFPDDGNRYELLDGVLLVTPLAGFPHQLVASHLVAVLNAYLREGAARVFSPGCIQRPPNLHLEPDILVVPTAAFPPKPIARSHWKDIGEWWLAVEISGRTSRVYDRDHKGPAYIALGVREYWRVDIRDQCIYVSRPKGLAEEPHPDSLTWLPPGRPEPLLIKVPELFA